MKTLHPAIGYTDGNEPVSLAGGVEVGPLLFGVERFNGAVVLAVQHPEFGRLRFSQRDLGDRNGVPVVIEYNRLFDAGEYVASEDAKANP